MRGIFFKKVLVKMNIKSINAVMKTNTKNMEENLEKIYNDKTAWVSFFTDDEKTNEAFVYTRCTCGRYLKHGEILYNPYSEEVRFKGWICKKCGEVEPYLSRE